jgi:hypothetical protein
MSIHIADNVTLGSPSFLPFSHPRLLYDDIVSRGALTASSDTTGFEVENVADFLTSDFWRPTTSTFYLVIDLDDAVEVDYFMIAAHTMGTCKSTVHLDYWDGTGWQVASTVAPGTDSVFASFFKSVFSNRFRLYFSPSWDPLETPAIPSIGVAMVGKALAVERKLFRQHVPITFGRRTVIKPQSSEAGQWLGRTIQREGVATTISFSNITSAWMREKFDPFIKSARSQPFGWAWRPEKYPGEVAYCWTVADISPQNTGPRDLMSVSFKVEGFA